MTVLIKHGNRMSNVPDLLYPALANVKVLKYYRLLDYDYDMSLLFNDLKIYIDERWPDGDIVFEEKEILLFNHTDVDFFIDENFPGFTLYNLQMILQELNIPNYFCVIISNLPNYKKYTRIVQHKLTNDSVDILPITSLILTIYNSVIHKGINLDQINFPFVVLSRLGRPHRTFFMAKLFDCNLHEKGLISYHNLSNSINHTTEVKSVKNKIYNFLLQTKPFFRHYPKILIRNLYNQKLFLQFQNTVSSFKNFNENIDINDGAVASEYQNSPLQNAFLYVALETVIHCNEVFLSIISFKGIVEKRPFVIFGVPGTIKYLNTLGFKTFNDFWDESYDQIENFEDRTQAILDILKSLSKKSSQELQSMLCSMQDILEYNFNHFINTFRNQELNHLAKELSSRYG